jgi:protein-L-isoaspartate(D-aspartate) O-methyltransferase
VAEDGFIPMKGLGAMPEQNVALGAGPDLTLRIDDGQQVEATLRNVVDGEPELVWTEVVSPWGWTPDQDFWLATMPGFCRVFVHAAAVTAGRVPRAKDPWGAWGAHSAGSLAYLTARQVSGTDEMPMLQVGACGYGPDGAGLARRLTDRVRAWQIATAGGIEVTITARRRPAVPIAGEDDALLIVEKTEYVFIVRAVRPRGFRERVIDGQARHHGPASRCHQASGDKEECVPRCLHRWRGKLGVLGQGERDARRAGQIPRVVVRGPVLDVWEQEGPRRGQVLHHTCCRVISDHLVDGGDASQDAGIPVAEGGSLRVPVVGPGDQVGEFRPRDFGEVVVV